MKRTGKVPVKYWQIQLTNKVLDFICELYLPILYRYFTGTFHKFNLKLPTPSAGSQWFFDTSFSIFAGWLFSRTRDCVGGNSKTLRCSTKTNPSAASQWFFDTSFSIFDSFSHLNHKTQIFISFCKISEPYRERYCELYCELYCKLYREL